MMMICRSLTALLCIVSMLMNVPAQDMATHATISKSVYAKAIPLNIKEIGAQITYPAEARSNEIEGTVICRIFIDQQGNYTRHEFVNDADPLLQEAVEPHVKAINFQPAKRNGCQVASSITLPFSFLLDDLEGANPEDQLAAATICQKEGRYDVAAAYLDRTIASRRTISSSEQKQYYQQRVFNSLRIKKWDDARRDINELIADAKENDLKTVPDLYATRAFAAIMGGDYISARNDYLFIEKFYPDFLPGSKSYVYTYPFSARDYRFLQTAYTQLLNQMEGKHKHLIHFLKGRCQLMLRDYVGAQQAFQAAIPVASSGSIAHAEIAWGLFKQGEYPEALTHLQLADESATPQSIVRYYLGQVLRTLDNPAEAQTALRSALALGLSEPHATHTRMMLDELAYKLR